MQTVQTENALPTSGGLRISPDGRILFATRFVHASTSSSSGLLYLLGPSILQHWKSLFIVTNYQTKLTELYYSYCILLN